MGIFKRFTDLNWYQRVMKRFHLWGGQVSNGSNYELARRLELAKGISMSTGRFIHRAQDQLLQTKLKHQRFNPPQGAEWAWCPDAWCHELQMPNQVSVKSGEKFGEQLSLFHDCQNAEIILRQTRRASEAPNRLPFAIRLEVFECDGSFCSLVLELPKSAQSGLSFRSIFRLDAHINMEKPVQIFARLNIKHGPNVETVLAKVDQEGDDMRAEFDLGYLDLNTDRLEQVWLDLIFKEPKMNGFTVEDLSLFRYPRAEL